MKTPNRHIILIILPALLLAGYQMGAQDDHLEPRCAYWNYSYQLNNAFLSLRHPDTLVEFIMLPAEEPEQFFFLTKQDSGRYVIEIRRRNGNSLHNHERGKSWIYYISYPVSEGFAMKLIRLYRLALSQTDYPSKHLIHQTGSLYLFTAKDENGMLRYGEKWSPLAGVNMQELVSISKDLIEKQPPGDFTEQAMEARMDTLIAKLENGRFPAEPKNTRWEYYDTDYWLNLHGDTIMAVKDEIEMIGSGMVKMIQRLATEYYVKDSTKSWKNITTGEAHVIFEVDKHEHRRFIRRKGKKWPLLRVRWVNERWRETDIKRDKKMMQL